MGGAQLTVPAPAPGPPRPGDLTGLNLNWSERDLPQRERTRHVHGLHPYLGKYPPQLVEALLRGAMRPDQTVLDPFCGSGTTLVQANESGLHAAGTDVSAFNVLLARAKTAAYSLPHLRHEVQQALQLAEAAPPEAESKAERPLPEPTGAPAGAPEAEPDAYLRRWYAPPARRQLLAYRAAITGGAFRYPDLLRVILSRAARSARLTTHFELDFPRAPQRGPYWCHKHHRECRPAQEALGFLRRYSVDTLRRVESFAAVRTECQVSVTHADGRSAAFPAAHGIITSPPYVGLIDYHQQHAYAYHLLGLTSLRGQEIGAPGAGTSRAARRRYQEDVALVLRRAAAGLPAGAPVLVVAADRHHLYPEIAALAGLEPRDVLQRQVNRRTGRRAGDFYESVFVWRKP
ncbi:MAG TPA: DNA methyltransferase [Chloroflexota bacterium]|nr:DNA methyltransferase [Chloroflexota bacterium]